MRFVLELGLVLISLLSLDRAEGCVEPASSQGDTCAPTLPIVYNRPVNPQPECNFFTFAFDTGSQGTLTLFAQQYGCDKDNYPIEGKYAKCQADGIERDCLVYKEPATEVLKLPLVYHSNVRPDSNCHFLTYGIDMSSRKLTLFVSHHDCDKDHGFTEEPGMCRLDGHTYECVAVARPPKSATEKEIPIVYRDPIHPNAECNFYTFAADADQDRSTLLVQNYGCDKDHYPIEGEYGRCQVGDRVAKCIMDKSGKGDGRSMPVVHHSKGDPASPCHFFAYGIDQGRDGPTLFVSSHECADPDDPIKGRSECELNGGALECLVVKKD